MERPAAASYSRLSEDEERKLDLTNWEKFINGTLKHF
jgi:hypothetical protein